ncbi:aminotransferase class I/II-fold pyridoxal phosphate-dependent enzyme [Vibrio lentus]|nr:aminotransferase class I/II-fold pyridoxal phosphate-dependent enzyme [Vibrio lentus]
MLNNTKHYIIEDDVYSDLYFERYKPKPLKAFDKTDSVLLCGSYSKTCPGYRVGWVVSSRFNDAIQKASTSFYLIGPVACSA